MQLAVVVVGIVAWYVLIKWLASAAAEEAARNRTAPEADAGARGVYLVHNPNMLRAHGLVVVELGYGMCVVSFREPGRLLDAGTPQARELLKAPSGAELIAVPIDDELDAPWRLDLHVPPSPPW